MFYRTHLLHHLFSLTQVGHSQSLPPLPCPVGPAQIPCPLQAFCSLLPAQRGEIVTSKSEHHKKKESTIKCICVGKKRTVFFFLEHLFHFFSVSSVASHRVLHKAQRGWWNSEPQTLKHVAKTLSGKILSTSTGLFCCSPTLYFHRCSVSDCTIFTSVSVA